MRTLLTDVAIELSARRGRAIMLLTAVALANGILMTSTAATLSAARQIDADLAAASTSIMTVTGQAPDPNALQQVATFPENTQARALDLDLVRAAGLRFEIANSDANPARLEYGTPDLTAQVLGVTSGYLQASGMPSLPPSAWQLDRVNQPYRVAYVGSEVATRLGIAPRRGLPRSSDLAWRAAVRSARNCRWQPGGQPLQCDLIPYHAALAMRNSADWTSTLLLRTAPGAGAPVAGVIREALRPDNPGALNVSAVNDFRDVRVGVDDQLARLSVGIGALLLGLASLLVANAMVVSVVARTPEIGLRRALGASSASVASVFLVEGGVVGVLGGLSGSALGVLASVAISAANNWSHHFPLLLVLAGPTLGLAIGIVSSAYPAIRAAQVAPSEALRAD